SGGTAAETAHTATTGASNTAGVTTGSVVESGCPDLNQNEVPDCEETLIGNATFEVNIEPWEVEALAEIRWQSAASDTASGALVITRAGPTPGEQPSMAGSFQCIAVQAQSSYRFLAQAFIPEGQPGVTAAISALFYASGDCTGTHLGVVNSASQSTAGSWRVLHDSGRAPAHAQSLKLRLAVVQTAQAATAEVLFDNVLVVRE
ncbi:MAG TPA: hypothetical protein VFU02_07885, partial [Polyangiaceae bacterium]|nr:hypothetical protein [Polyangiaceae bacterium]